MNKFIETLTSTQKNVKLAEEYNFFGKLIGSWEVDFIDNDNSNVVKGEWHFSWILEGMAIQDVIVLPNYEYGTTLRIYNPDTHTWNVVYGYTDKIMQLEARKQEDMIVLTFTNDKSRKWVFITIEDNSFHWQNVTVKDNGEWHINADLYAKRI